MAFQNFVQIPTLPLNFLRIDMHKTENILSAVEVFVLPLGDGGRTQWTLFSLSLFSFLSLSVNFLPMGELLPCQACISKNCNKFITSLKAFLS